MLKIKESNFYFFSVLFSILVTSISCSQASLSLKNKKNNSTLFTFKDDDEEYLLKKEVGDINKKKVFVKTMLFDEQRPNLFLEKNLSVSKIGFLKFKEKGLRVLRPEISQYTFWINGEKYFSQIKLNEKKKQLEVITLSPKAYMNDQIVFDFPSSKALYCFFSQITECVNANNFLSISRNKKAGKFSFYIIWDGHPFFQDQYNLPRQLFTLASFNYEGESKEGETQYALEFLEQNIFYKFDKNNRLLKKIWVSQGIIQEAQH